MKTRQSNFELMRIISMFMIIVWHIFLYGVNTITAAPNINLFYDFFKSIIVVHVNSFVLLSGYFLINSSFKMTKLVKLNNAVIFYKIIIYLIFIYLGIAETTSPTIIRNFFPLDLENYWFIRIYIIMYIFAPFFNTLINNLTQKELKKLILTMFFLFSIISTITMQEALVNYTVSYGSSIISFTFLYFIGAYLKKYPIDDTYIGKKYSKNFKQLISIIMFFILAFINFSIHITSEEMLKYNGFLNYIGTIINIGFDKFDNPIVIIQSISYFMFFYYMAFSNKLVNTISKTVFGIYLIHENIYIRNNIYKLFKFPVISISKTVFIHIYCAACIIFIVCFIIELIRQTIFKIIYNFKISKWWRQKYRNYLKSLGLEINW